MIAPIPLLFALASLAPAQAAGPPRADEPTGVARIRHDAEALRPLVSSALARDFLAAVADLPAIAPRTLYRDPERRAVLTEEAAARLGPEARRALEPLPVDESFYYETKYGSPLAYARPLEVLGRAGVADAAGLKVLDFGYGTIGHLRLLAALGADTVGVDVDPLLPALYSRPEDRGAVAGRRGRPGSIRLIDGRFPADDAVREAVGGGYDLILSKNTLKNGYIHPAELVDRRRTIDLGVDDAAFVATLYAALKPGGHALIYNLSPAPSPPGQPYKPWADGRCPFPKRVWEAAGFRVLALDEDDSAAARAMGRALGWGRGEGAIDLERDLFAGYTLVQRPRGD
jgi:SAM-dependent methyltransferase